MTVLRLLAGRVFTAILTLILVSLLIFVIIEVLPGDVASRILGRDATTASLAALRAQLHLGDPAVTRYLRWLAGALHGDFGTSLVSGRQVGEVLLPRIQNTALLSAFAFLLYLPLAIVPAIIQAVNRDRSADHALSIGTLVLMSTPDFLFATILMIVFVIWFPIFPAISLIDANSTAWHAFRAMVLPAMTLAVTMAVYAVRMLRDNLIEVLGSDYVRMAELKGLKRMRVLLRHALPNGLVPTLNVTALNLSYLIGGVVIVERVFSFPGFGGALVDALQLRDVPVIEASVLISAAIYITANLLADIGSILLNPRLRNA
jgi:peptide/nickel transport system permease protein